MNAEVVAIGTELLLGEIADTNTQAIARGLRRLGIDLFRTTVVGDNPRRIADAILESLSRSHIVITTGGLGPTVDDPTREAVALALGVPTEFRDDLWERIQERFARFGRTPSENNRRQAYLPAGARPIENPVGTAPAFLVELGERCIISLPGVPEEMVALLERSVLPYLRERYSLQEVIHSRVLHTAGLGESVLDEHIAELETLANPTVGLSAHPGQVDIRITAKAQSQEQAEAMIRPIETLLRERLGSAIYGVDEERLSDVALRALAKRGWRLAVVESGTEGRVTSALAGSGQPFAVGEVLPAGAEDHRLEECLNLRMAEFSAQAGLIARLTTEGRQHALTIVLRLPDGVTRREWSFGGASRNVPRWAANLCLDLLRRQAAET